MAKSDAPPPPPGRTPVSRRTPGRERTPRAERAPVPGRTPVPGLALRLTPRGHLELVTDDTVAGPSRAVVERLRAAFAHGSGPGLLHLGAREVQAAVPAVLAYWRDFAAGYLTAVCTQAPGKAAVAEHHIPAPQAADLGTLCLAAPPMTGAEYLNVDSLGSLWDALDAAFAQAWEAARVTLPEFLKSLNPAWNLVGRVHFHLSENPANAPAPFTFRATYTAKLTADARLHHQPLGQARREYAGAQQTQRLAALLAPVERAAGACRWLGSLVTSDEIFRPLDWSAAQALRLLRDVHLLEAAGVVVHLPREWRERKPPRPQVSAIVGSMPPAVLDRKSPGILGGDALLDFRMQVTLDGDTLTGDEIRELLGRGNGLVQVRGRWVEIDRDRLRKTIQEFERIEALAAAGGIRFATASRMLAGAGDPSLDPSVTLGDWSQVSAGPWLRDTLSALRSPGELTAFDPGRGFRGTLRPYQDVGVRWLHFCSQLGLGACLADDMGLGKTIQVLALLLALQHEAGPSLLVAPASLLANWRAEAARFTPRLRLLVAHPSTLTAPEMLSGPEGGLAGIDLVVTSYGSLLRMPWILTTAWNLAILDEAQAIKNPGAKQTHAAKRLQARARIALTGTPIENRLADLWSIFDFINPGLLGSGGDFAAFAKRLASGTPNAYAPLRELVRPYILRRLKTDKAVIADLPDKTELRTFCLLSPVQAALYQQAVDDLGRTLTGSGGATGIQRKGAVLASLLRLKQICNHPSQWLHDGVWAEDASGKWARLRELAEVIAAKQEKVLVFTQFAALTAPLAAFLSRIFEQPGVVLTGSTPVPERQELVQRFQEDESVPFFVLSLKAGGAGLNLTAAAHVIHFDRWWNPAVENQATDRAFRIGQRKNVLVHKFVCQGTVEERIDALIDSKKKLSRDLLEGGAEVLLTEMSNEDLLRLVELDLAAAIEGT